MDRLTKKCPRCKHNLNINKFSVCRVRYDGVQAYCTSCMKLYRVESYHRSPKSYKIRAGRLRESIRELIREQKNKPCMDCEIIYPYYVMEFDHTENNKEYIVSQLVSSGNISKIMTEISKCDVVCSNCHRERTYRRAHDAILVSKTERQ